MDEQTNQIARKRDLLKEHYKIANGRRCGTEHKLDDNYMIIIYDHDAIHLDSPAKARLEYNGEYVELITAKEPESLDFENLFKNLIKEKQKRD